QLMSAGVVSPTIKKTADKPKVKVIGKLEKALIDRLQFNETDIKKADLLILIRTRESLSGFIDEYEYLNIDKPHLFLDLAYEHTVSLGPLVFPGLTSCVACLKGRIESRWGDHLPPPETRAVSELGPLAFEWLVVEIERIFGNEDYSLVNKTLVM